MVRNHTYYTLITSLPTLPAHFDVERSPISWPRPEDRLRMLEPGDAETLTRLLDVFAWDRQPLDRTDDEVIAQYKSLIVSVRHPLVRKIIDDRIDMRILLIALRRRRLGLGPPPTAGRWADPIRRRYNHPQFGLQTRFPWIAELDVQLAAGAVCDAERLILSVTWKKLSRAGAEHYFSFEALLSYVARWALVNCWTSQNAAVGRGRFENALLKLLESHVQFDN